MCIYIHIYIYTDFDYVLTKYTKASKGKCKYLWKRVMYLDQSLVERCSEIKS